MAQVPTDLGVHGVPIVSIAYGWFSEGLKKTEPPYTLAPDYQTGSDEVLGRLASCPWLFPPGVDRPEEPADTARPVAPDLTQAKCFDLRGAYEFKHLRTSRTQEVVQILLAPASIPTGQGRLRDGFHGDPSRGHTFQVSRTPLTDSQKQQYPYMTDLEPYQFCSNYKKVKEGDGFTEYICLGHHAETQGRKFVGTLSHADGRTETIKVDHGFLVIGSAAPKRHTISSTSTSYSIGTDEVTLHGTTFEADGSFSGTAADRAGSQIGSFRVRSEETLATIFCRALGQFAVHAYQVLTAVSQGASVVPETERHTLVTEAALAVEFLVRAGHINHQDLFFALEAYGVGKGRPLPHMSWLCDCLGVLLTKMLEASPSGSREAWVESMKSRVQHEVEVASYVDVRAWPQLLKLLGTDTSILDRETFKTQVQVQLCMGAGKDRLDGWRQAAKTIAFLKLQECFDIQSEFLDIFNDRRAFDRSQRTELLQEALRGAPADYVQEVLREIDDADVDVNERDDEEMRMVENLLVHFKQDIRCCPHAYYKMKTEWIAYRSNGGVVLGEELSPEQICDHIEDDPNHQELLKLAVNKMTRLNRKFEVARMLARPASRLTRAFETNKNDNQLAYLVSLYEDVDPRPDSFGPIEAEALRLPAEVSDVLEVNGDGSALQQLEADLLQSGWHGTVSLAWQWRCFNPRMDFWPRATLLTIAYNSPQRGMVLAYVDFDSIEVDGHDEELRCKDVLKQILEAPHLLKLVHDMEGYTFEILQRAVLPRDELHMASASWPMLAPVLDLGVVAAFIHGTRPMETSVTKLTVLAFNYLRLELCLAEALSNFERRPLRQSQLHYALSLAWCPLLILRSLCCFDIVRPDEILLLVHRLGHREGSGWTKHLRSLSFENPEQPGVGGGGAGGLNLEGEETNVIIGAYAEDLWTGTSEDARDWRERLPRPGRRINLCEVMRYTEPIHLLSEQREPAQQAVHELFSNEVVQHDLAALYASFHKHLGDTGRGSTFDV